MTVDQNSIDAYFQTADKRASQRKIILDTIRAFQQSSSSDIHAFTGIPRTSVCGRLKELEDEGVIYKAGTKTDPITNVTVNWYAEVKQ